MSETKTHSIDGHAELWKLATKFIGHARVIAIHDLTGEPFEKVAAITKAFYMAAWLMAEITPSDFCDVYLEATDVAIDGVDLIV